MDKKKETDYVKILSCNYSRGTELKNKHSLYYAADINCSFDVQVTMHRDIFL